jgi:hypothetical protein
MESLTQMTQGPDTGTTPSPRFVLLPGKATLHYELKLGMEITYVDAKTGVVSFHKDIYTF